MAERTARIIGLDCVGIDALVKDISLPLEFSGLNVVQVNAAPEFRMQLEPTVDHIVLEIARGGIVRRGLGVDALDVGILLNIGEDHLGIDWIDSQDQLCMVKSTVIEVIKKTGTSVLNAEDPATMSVLERARGNIILFSLDPENPNIRAHIKEGGIGITLDGRSAVIRSEMLDIMVCTLEEIPITFGGIIDFNTANAFAAIGALHGLGLPLEQIRNGIMTFYPTVNQNPGRMNLFDFLEYKVLLDFGHNPDSARAFEHLLPRLSPGRKIGLFHGTGNRTSEQLIDYGKALALGYDYIMLTDFDPRNRPFGETPKLVYEGLIKGGFSKENIEIIQDPDKAVDTIFSKVKSGDLLVIQPNELEPVMGQIMKR